MNAQPLSSDISCGQEIENIKRAIRENETWFMHFDLGSLFIRTGQFSNALQAFFRGLELRPKWEPNSCGNMLEIFSVKGYTVVFEEFKARSFQKKKYQNYYFIGWSLYQMNRIEEAIQVFRVLSEKSDDRNCFLGLAASLHADGNLDAAASIYKEASMIDTSNAKGNHTDEKLNFLIGASSYDAFPQRLNLFKNDLYNYNRKSGKLSSFILLAPWETECLYRYSTVSKHGIVEIGRAKGGQHCYFRCLIPE